MAGHADAQRYIVDTLEALGWQVELEEGVLANTRWAATLTNIVATRPEAPPGPALVLMSHYDGVPTGPAAGDAGAGVGTILEIARLLDTRPAKMPVRLLLTDGEEIGLMGARLHIRDNGTEDIAAVVNLEARGGGGPALMFESHYEHSGFVDAFSRSGAPVATSLADEVYRRMPNDTDFSVFRDAGVPGLNFAFLGKFLHYHSALDTAEGLDARSVQHLGEGAWGVLQNLDTESIHAEAHNQVHFPLPGRLLARYPSGWALPLAILAALAVAAAVGARSGARAARGAGWSALATILATIIAGGLGFAVSAGLPELALLTPPFPTPYGLSLWALGILLAAAAAGRVGVLRSDAPGAVGLWALAALGTAALVPGGSYLFTWPAVAGAIAPGLGALVGWLLITPLLGLLFDALGLLAAAPAGLLVGMLVSLSLPVLSERVRAWAPAGAGALGLLCLGAAAAGSGIDAEHPGHGGVVYWDDVTRSTALRYTYRPESEGGARVSHPLLWWNVDRAPAAAGEAEPFAIRQEVQPRDGGATVNLTVQTTHEASFVSFRFSDSARVRNVRVDGVSVGERLVSGVFADLPSGVSVGFDVEGDTPLVATILVTSFGLPAGVEGLPTDRISSPWGMGVPSATIVSQEVRLLVGD